MFKKKLFACLVIAVLVGMIVGCSASTSAKKSESVTITFLSTQEPGHGRSYFMQNVIKPAFEKKYPNIHLNVIVVPWDQFDTKLSTLVGAGNPPDVWSDWGSSGFGDYYHRGLAADLTSLMQKSGWKNANIPQSLMDIYNVGGKQYALPLGWFPSFVVYNKSLFQQSGVQEPKYAWNSPEWTWDQMVSVAKKLTKNYGKPDAMYGVFNNDSFPDNLGWDWGTEAYSNANVSKVGYGVSSDVTNPKYIQAIKAYQDLIFKDKVSPTPAITQAFSSGGDPFLTGKIGMEISGSWLLSNAKQSNMQIGIAPIPKGPAGTATSFNFTDPLIISKNSKHMDASWDLITFMDSPEMQKAYLNTTGNLPADDEAAKDWYKNYESSGIPEQELKTMTQQALKNGRESMGNVLAGYAQISNFFQNNLQPIFNDGKDPSVVLPKIKPQFDQLLSQIHSNMKQ